MTARAVSQSAHSVLCRVRNGYLTKSNNMAVDGSCRARARKHTPSYSYKSHCLNWLTIAGCPRLVAGSTAQSLGWLTGIALDLLASAGHSL